MKIKETAKKFWEDNKKLIADIVVTSGVIGASYMLGAKITSLKVDAGLWRVMSEHPEVPLKDLYETLKTYKV